MSGGRFDFDMYFNGVHGGPCPVCHRMAELKRFFGYYAEGADKRLIHVDDLGVPSVCTFRTSEIVISTIGGRWRVLRGTPGVIASEPWT